MELQQILERYAEAIEYVDKNPQVIRSDWESKNPQFPSFLSLDEKYAVDGIDAAWDLLHPGELLGPAKRLGVKYPGIPYATCDHVFSTLPGEQEEWSLEVKRIQFVGNNGKNNDFGVGKVLSPYLKDRGLLHDAVRIREYGFTRRIAVVAYMFEYDTDSCDEAEALHPEHVDIVNNVRGVIHSNGGALRARQLMDLTDAILGLRGYLRGPRAQMPFTAWRHPAGGHGIVFGWEIRRPHLEPDYDPRHPW